MLSAGLFNITDVENTQNIPIQTTMMHYKSKDDLKDVVTASSFMVFMAFNETQSTIFEQTNKPDLNSKVDLILLTSSSDKLIWTWEIKYSDLAAFWWKTSFDPQNPTKDPKPIALTIYDELTFTYTLTINPETGKTPLGINYTSGKIQNLYVFW